MSIRNKGEVIWLQRQAAEKQILLQRQVTERKPLLQSVRGKNKHLQKQQKIGH